MKLLKQPTAQTVSAFIMLLAGIGLNIASFAVPPVGVLSDSVMTFMGEALIYAASVFGMKAYVEQKIRDKYYVLSIKYYILLHEASDWLL